MKRLIAVAILVLAVSALNEKAKWESFKVKHGKSYINAVQENHRYSVFVNNLKKINEHNAKYNAGLSSYYMGVNQFTDLTEQEIQQLLVYRKSDMPQIQAQPHEYLGLTVPRSVDWREKGAVTEVKYQGNCGSCWAFSATGVLEGQNYIINNQSVSLSEQELLDCSTEYGEDSCRNGGEVTTAYLYVKNHGLGLEDDYPYEANQLQCRVKHNKRAIYIQGFKNVSQSEAALAEAVANIGPISVGINAGPLMQYAGGIFSDRSCVSNPANIGHAVLVVGYGEENGTSYWIIKNSWGTAWGEKGYLRLEKGADLCGISLLASYPVLRNSASSLLAISYWSLTINMGIHTLFTSTLTFQKLRNLSILVLLLPCILPCMIGCRN